MIVEFFNNVADLATNALTEELNTSVKFGLVCPSHNGSHDDLDFELMKKSINSLYDGFVALVKVGFEFNAPLENLLNEARKVGLESEKAMFKATNGSNTHKGALFCIGLFCVAIGWLVGRGESFSPKNCSKVIAKICKGICKRELTNTLSPTTHGEKMYAKYSVSGARGSAERGFLESVENFLPIWKQIKTQTENYDLAKTRLLAYVVSKTDDTNILYRSDEKTLALAQNKCRDLYLDFDEQKAKETEDWFINLNISCGGSADMLGLTLFLDGLEEFEINFKNNSPKRENK